MPPSKMIGDDEEAKAYVVTRAEPADDQEPDDPEDAEDEFLAWAKDMDARDQRADAAALRRDRALGAIASCGVDVTRSPDDGPPLCERSEAYLVAFAEARCDGFNPDQSRDADGKFGEGGGGGKGSDKLGHGSEPGPKDKTNYKGAHSHSEAAISHNVEATRLATRTGHPDVIAASQKARVASEAASKSESPKDHKAAAEANRQAAEAASHHVGTVGAKDTNPNPTQRNAAMSESHRLAAEAHDKAAADKTVSPKVAAAARAADRSSENAHEAHSMGDHEMAKDAAHSASLAAGRASKHASTPADHAQAERAHTLAAGAHESAAKAHETDQRVAGGVHHEAIAHHHEKAKGHHEHAAAHHEASSGLGPLLGLLTGKADAADADENSPIRQALEEALDLVDVDGTEYDQADTDVQMAEKILSLMGHRASADVREDSALSAVEYALARFDEFNEEDHPRDEKGKFGAGAREHAVAAGKLASSLKQQGHPHAEAAAKTAKAARGSARKAEAAKTPEEAAKHEAAAKSHLEKNKALLSSAVHPGPAAKITPSKSMDPKTAAQRTADKLSTKANDLSPKAHNFAEHMQAAGAHREAAQAHSLNGDKAKAAEHTAKAEKHGEASKASPVAKVVESQKAAPEKPAAKPDHERTFRSSVDDYEHSGDTEHHAEELKHSGAVKVQEHTTHDEDGESGHVSYSVPKGVTHAQFSAVHELGEHAQSHLGHAGKIADAHHADVKRQYDIARQHVKNGEGAKAAAAVDKGKAAVKARDKAIHGAPAHAASVEASDQSKRAHEKNTTAAHMSAAHAHDQAASLHSSAGNPEESKMHRAKAAEHRQISYKTH